VEELPVEELPVEGIPQTRTEAIEADRLDPLASYRDEFVVSPAGPIYLDGNSLGRRPRATAPAVARLLDEWGRDLVGGWDRWADLPVTVGDRIGQLIGAAPGQVVVSDSTTVNLYKLAMAAVDAKADRTVIVGDAEDFPTVRYVLQGIAAERGRRLRLVATDAVEGITASPLPATGPARGPVPPAGAEDFFEAIIGRADHADGAHGPDHTDGADHADHTDGADGADHADHADHADGDIALVCLSAVNYRSGAVADLTSVTDAAHRAGALVLWDLSHAAGAVPVDLDGSGVDLAVGCSYKYLNGGPGAPAWAYVRAGLQASLRQPVWGWWGQRDQFAMGAGYDPVPNIARFLSGTPDVLGTVAVDCGIAPLLAAGMPALWAKTRRLVALLARRTEQLLVPLGARTASPSDPGRRGGHLAISHPDAYNAARLLIERGLVVPDFRAPDVLRLAPVALYTGFVDVWDATEHVASVLTDPAVHLAVPRKRVT
jgi:kynureninase